MNENNIDIAAELARLHVLRGADFVRQLKMLVGLSIFKPVEGENGIFAAGGERSEDYNSQLLAARKAVEHGNKVFILPNPKDVRTADFIFVYRSSYKMYDLKTIQGKASASARLLESVGQSNRILLNMNSDYNARLLASDIKSYFEANANAVEVLIFKGRKVFSVSRYQVDSPMFNRQFRKKFEK